MYSKILITGGAGFIGFWTTKELLSYGVKVRILDLPMQIERMKSFLPSDVEIIYGSIMDKEIAELSTRGIDAIIHLAAILGVKRTEQNKLKCLDVNIGGTKNILEAAVNNKVKKILFASSSEVYGESLNNPIKEEDPCCAKTVYGISKLAGEQLCKAYFQRYGLTYTILRYFNTYGPYQVAQFVIPRFIYRLKNNLPIEIYGEGDQIRSYCYVEDAAKLTIKALFNKNADRSILNIGNSKEVIDIKTLALKILALIGKDTSFIVKKDFSHSDRDKKREIFVKYPDTTKAKRILGFSANISLEEGINRVLKNCVLFEDWVKD